MVQARFAPDGKTVVYSAMLNGGPLDTYIIREDYPEAAPAGLHGATLLSISNQGQLALLVHPQFFAHRQWFGTLATSPIGGGAPRELLENVYEADWSPDGNSMAIIDRDHGKWRVEYPLSKVLLEGDNWLSDLRVSPDGEQIALFRHPPNVDDRGEVVLLDRSGHLRVLSEGWESLEGLAWTPSGKEVWVSAAESGEQYCIRAVTPAGKQRAIYCGVASTLVRDIAPSGRVLVSAEEQKASMAITGHGSTAERDLNWLDHPYGPRFSWDGSEVLFTDLSEHAGSGYSVYVRKTDGSPAVRIAEGGFATDLTPDGKWALVLLPADPAARLQIVPIGPGQTRAFHWQGIQPLWAWWFPDGQQILLAGSASGQGSRLYVTDVNGSTPKSLATVNGDWVLVAPDGRSLLALENGGRVVRSIQGNTAKPIPGLQAADFPIA